MFSKLLPVFMICALFFGVQQNSHAQAGRLSLGGGLGAGRLTGDLGSGGSFGLSANVESSYFIKPKLSIGIMLGANALFYGNDSSLVGISTYGDRLFLAKADYFFWTKYSGLMLRLRRVWASFLRQRLQFPPTQVIVPFRARKKRICASRPAQAL